MPLVLLRWCWPLVLSVVVLAPLQAQQPGPEGALLRAVGLQGWRAFELAHRRDTERWLQDEPVYQGLWLREGGAPDSSVFDFLPFASAPRNRDGAAVAYDQGTGGRMWAGFTRASAVRAALLGAGARAALELWRLFPPVDGGPRDLLGPRPCPGMRLRVGAEEVFGFGTDGRDQPPESRALMVYAQCERELGNAWHVGAGLRGYHWRTPGAPDRQDLESSLRLAHLPSDGGLLVFLDGSWTPDYHRAVLHVERPFTAARLRLRPLMRVAWGEGLPYSLGFWPGGLDGFPGLTAGARRGDREATLALDAQYPIAGRLSLRAMVATGRTADGGSIVSGRPWLLGARAGLNLETRLGLMRVEYGVATEDHRALFIRLGHIL